MALTEMAVRNAKAREMEATTLSDGDGLMLLGRVNTRARSQQQKQKGGSPGK